MIERKHIYDHPAFFIGRYSARGIVRGSIDIIMGWGGLKYVAVRSSDIH